MATNETLIPIPGRLHSVASEGHVAGADEIYDDTQSKLQSTINSELYEAIGSGGSVDQQIDAKIAALDSTKSQTAGSDGLALSITETDGKIASISGSIASGTYATLENGKVPSSQLPAYVDDVLEYANLAAFPAQGEAGKIYVALDTNKTYRWSGSAYVEISESLAIGETSTTAFAGSRGVAIEGKIPSAATSSNKLVDAASMNSALALKANQSDLTALTGRVTTAESEIDNLQSNVSEHDSEIAQVTALVNQKQLEIGAVQSDVVPTRNSANYVTSGGIYNSLVKKAYLKQSTNIFSLSGRVQGKYIDYRTGQPGTAAAYSYVYITSVTKSYYFSYNQDLHIAFFNGDTYISGVLGIGFIEVPDNCTKFSVSFTNDNTNVTINPLYINSSDIEKRSIPKDRIVEEVLEGVLEQSKNIFSLQGRVTGKYIDYNTGQEGTAAAYSYVYLNVDEDSDYVITGNSDNGLHIAYFNGSTYISGVPVSTGGGSIHTPVNCTRMSVSFSNADTNLVVAKLEYVLPYSKLPKQLFDSTIKPVYVVDKSGNGDYTSLVEAIASGRKNVIYKVMSGVYDIIAEYKAHYGNSYFDNYNGIYNGFVNGLMDTGLYLDDGVELIGVGDVVIQANFDSVNESVKTYFSVISTSANNMIENITIQQNGKIRYHIHDDFANYVANSEGTNIFKDITFTGSAVFAQTFGAGMGVRNAYVLDGCHFLTSDEYAISYHNNAGSNSKNSLRISNCYCPNGKIVVRCHGTSTEKTNAFVSNCRAVSIDKEFVSGSEVDNINLYTWNNSLS